MSLKFRFKLPQNKTPEKNPISPPKCNQCRDCGLSFSSTKALFGHSRIHRKKNKSSLPNFTQSKHVDVIAAKILLRMSGSTSEENINDAKIIRLKSFYARTERHMKMKMKAALREQNTFQSEAKEVDEIHPCDQCDMVFNSGQALGGHKRKHYTGPPFMRPGGQGKLKSAVNVTPKLVVVHDFDLNEPAEEMCLD